MDEDLVPNHPDPPRQMLDVWFLPNHLAIPKLRKLGPCQIGRVSQREWQHLLKGRPEIPVYGGRYIVRNNQSR